LGFELGAADALQPGPRSERRSSTERATPAAPPAPPAPTATAHPSEIDATAAATQQRVINRLPTWMQR
jgi:hypothetical protein